MYYKQINPLGCLFWLIIFGFLFFKLKLYYLIYAIVILFIIASLIFNLKKFYAQKQEEKEKNYEPQMGEVYKVCPYCGNNIKRGAETCPHCNKKLN